MKRALAPWLLIGSGVAIAPAAQAEPFLRCLSICSSASNSAGGTVANLGQAFTGRASSGTVVMWIGVLPCLSGACYANCDESTATPVLNINDFLCFQARYAAGEPYANCDASTSPPVLNINDFICFQAKFAAGCP